MHPDYSLENFGRFLNLVEQKGLVGGASAQGWRVASSRVLVDLPVDQAADLRKIDFETAFRRFTNLQAGNLSPNSLQEYGRRARLALAEFVDWATDPSGYKPKASKNSRSSERNGRTSGSNRPAKRPAVVSTPQAAPTPHQFTTSQASSTGLTLPFPLRADFLAQVVIPRDLNVDEARRLGAFILALASDYKPTA